MSARSSGSSRSRRSGLWAVLAVVLVLLAGLGDANPAAAHPPAAHPAAPAVPGLAAASSEDPAASSSTAVPDLFGTHTPIMVVMDTSGSMSESAAGADGVERSRMDAARSAVLDLLPNLGGEQRLGMLAYPGGSSSKQIDGCESGDVVVGLSTLNVPVAAAAVRALSEGGGTPTGPALKRGAELLEAAYGAQARGVIVLVSDGQPTCGPPPCEVADALRTSGLEVQVNTVGMNLDPGAEEAMRCVASATGGTYIDVADGGDLATAIAQGAQGALALSVDAPLDIGVVTGASTSSGSTFAVTVSSTGRLLAGNVRVSLVMARGEGGDPGSILVPRPVRFVGNLEPGDSATVEFTVRPDDVGSARAAGLSFDEPLGAATWTVTAIANNAATVTQSGSASVVDTLDPGRLGGVLAGVERVVVLGDSFSSGEGAKTYLAGTDGGGGANRCHRSPLTYAGALWGADNVTILACSGAVTGDFTGGDISGGQRMLPQLLALRDVVLSDDPPQAVILSIGGNDADFGGVVTGCIGRLRCDSDIYGFGGTTPHQSVMERARGVQAGVARTLTYVDEAVNDQVALDRRGGQVIPVILVPYPQLLPPTLAEVQAPGGCVFAIGREEVRMLNVFTDELNGAVVRAGQSVAATGRPVYIATDVIDAFSPDHSLCEGTASYANPVDVSQVLDPSRKPEQVHPNVAGYQAMGRALVAWSTSPAAAQRSVSGAPVWSPNVMRRRVTGLDETLANPKLDGNPATAGGPLYVQADGFAPGTGVVIRLDSEPRVLAAGTADGKGRVEVWVRLPVDVPTGDHHTVVFGQDSDGRQVAAVAAVRVWPQGGTWLVILGGVGVVLLLMGAGLLGVTRRRLVGLGLVAPIRARSPALAGLRGGEPVR